MSYRIIDLDGTVINSEHRKNTLPDGNLDLAHWIENNTPDKIMADSLLPLATEMRKMYYSGIHHVIVCTARVLSETDYEFFLLHNLPYHAMLDRPQDCTMADHTLKDIQLRLYAHKLGISWRRFASQCVLYDDNQKVLSHLKSIGIAGVDAVQLNEVLAA